MVVTYYNLEFYTFFPGDLSTMSLLEPLGLKSHPIIFTKWFFIFMPCRRRCYVPSPTYMENYFDEVYNQTQLLCSTWKSIQIANLHTHTQTIQNANSCNECFGEKLQQVMLIWLIFLFIRCVEVVNCCCCWLFDY